MAEVANQTAIKIINFYKEAVSFFPDYIGTFFNFLALVLLIVLYSFIIWKFYKFISRKNLLNLDLNKYNKAAHSVLARVLTWTFYFIEYILILPFFVFIIFIAFTLFLMLLSESGSTAQILIVSAVTICAIRMTSYYKESLSSEISKLLPFNLLAFSISNPGTFLDANFIERIVNHIASIPLLLGDVKIYIIFIVLIEIVLRFFDLILSFFDLED